MTPDWQEIAQATGLRLTPPPERCEVDAAEGALACHFSPSLRATYEQTNAILDEWGYAYVLPIAELVEQNKQLRSMYADVYMSFDDLIIFGQLGNGDLLFQPRVPDGNDNVFLWDHEDDSRTWYGRDVEDALRRLAAN